MRTELAKRKNIGSRNKALARKTYRGTYQRTGKKHGKQHGATLLLTDIHQKGSGKILTNHLWLNYTREFAKLDELIPGDIIEFDGRIDTYHHLTSYAKYLMTTDHSYVPTPDDYYLEYRLIRPSNTRLCKRVRCPKGYQRHELAWMTKQANFDTRINRFAKYQTVQLKLCASEKDSN